MARVAQLSQAAPKETGAELLALELYPQQAELAAEPLVVESDWLEHLAQLAAVQVVLVLV